MSKYLLFALPVILLASCSGDKVIDQKLMAAASDVNKTCPVMVDRETRLDNAAAMPGRVFQYRYTIVNYTAAQIIDTNKMKQALEPNMIQGLKTMPEMKFFRENKVTMEYSYRDKDGKYIMKIAIKPEAYTQQ